MAKHTSLGASLHFICTLDVPTCRLDRQPHGSRLLLMLLRPPAATCKPSLASVDHASAQSASTVPRQYNTKRQGKADE